MKAFNVVELLGKAHTKLSKAFQNELIDFESYNQISDLILEGQKKFIDNFDYDKQNEVLNIKKQKEDKNEKEQRFNMGSISIKI